MTAYRVIVAAFISSGYLIRSRRAKKPKAQKSCPQVFISYRRKVSAGYANIIHDKLEERGACVFLDVDDIHAGSFSDSIEENIIKSDYFIVILAPTTLKSEWVVKEIKYAHKHGKVIIPVLLYEFDLYGSEIAEELKFIQSQNAVRFYDEYVVQAIEKIAKFIGLE